MTRLIATFAVMSAFAIAASSLVAGPLTPPAGPPASTYKTLTEVEPRIAVNTTNTPGDVTSEHEITQPGSYYLTENITASSGNSGIKITSSDVTLDLNGFRIDGVAGSLHGVFVHFGNERIVIRNGIIEGLSGSGTSGIVNNVTVEDVSIFNCQEYGIDLSSNTVVRDCIIDSAVLGGVRALNQSVVTNTKVTNTQTGTGIETAIGGRVENCAVDASGDGGIVVAWDSYVSACNVTNSGGKGVMAGFRGTIRDTSVLFSGSWGLELEIGSSAYGCVVMQGSSFGIVGRTNTLISDCVVSQNAHTGISVESGSKVIGNTVASNGFANIAVYVGIFVGLSSDGCVIRDNDLMFNATNIKVSGTGNTIVRNTSSTGLTAGLDIAAGNFEGAPVANPAAAGPWDNIDN